MASDENFPIRDIMGTFEDEEIADTLWPPDRNEANPMPGGMGSLGGGPAGQSMGPEPSIPGADDGVPDSRAIDPKTSIQELLGLDPEQAARQQQREIDEDNDRFEMKARFNIMNGIPREDWDPALKSWVEGLSSGGNGFQ